MPRVTFTKEGFEKAKKELEDYKLQRVDAVEHLKKSRELGDLRENGYYQASRQKVNHIDRQIRQLTYNLKYGVISDTPIGDTIAIGSQVTIEDDKREYTYSIVGDTEADSLEGKISVNSPLGSALSGKRVGDSVTYSTPTGKRSIMIKTITA